MSGENIELASRSMKLGWTW